MFVACGIWCSELTLIKPIFSVLAHAEKQFFSKLVLELQYPDKSLITGFSWRAKNGEKRKTSEVIVATEIPSSMRDKLSRSWPEKRLGSSLVLKLYRVMLNRILTQYL